MKRQSVLFVCGLLCLIAAVLYVQRRQVSSPTLPLSDPATTRLDVGASTLTVELADTTDEITKGLGFRDELGSDGMLFVLPTRSIPNFWMRGMRFPLDFVWIDGDRVVDLTPDVPHEPGVPDHALRTYSPKQPVTMVLELPSGDIRRLGVQIGDRVMRPVEPTGP